MSHDLRDIEAREITGVQIGQLGHKLWVCVDGECVLRIKSPKIQLQDARDDSLASRIEKAMESAATARRPFGEVISELMEDEE